MHVTEHVWRLEDNFWELLLIFNLVEAWLVSAAMMHIFRSLAHEFLGSSPVSSFCLSVVVLGLQMLNCIQFLVVVFVLSLFF